MSILPSIWEVPEIFTQRLGKTVGRQRLMKHEGHLLLVLHEVPEPGVPERQGVFFWRDPSGDWKTSERGGGKPALRELVTRYVRRVDSLEEAYGEAKSASRLFPVLRAITPIVRASKHVHQVLQATREALPADKEIIDLRDRAGEVERAAELLNSEARDALDFDIAESAEEQAKLNQELALSGQRLNLLAALFLPLTAVASVFGMNVPSGLEHFAEPLLFWIVLVVGIVVGLLLRTKLSGPESR